MAPKIHGLNGMHTAGIFSDMTVDGPEIGTLVVIVDRAKNLPNRKTIGKQDPYCAARLGKEAKKTDTDRRGGQTPRWDQELRYTVHDSPDYYQLKVSVFNDDKKTDLIGECWVDLKEVVVPGGGQNDLWHTLSCKSKYAGEIRIEITYYDTRPKEERPQKTKQAAADGAEEGRDSLRGPRQAKTPIKRRPLPSDPVTGEAPPLAIPDHVQTPPRGYPLSPTGAPDYASTPPRGYPPNGIPDHVATPTRGYQNSPSGIPDHVQTPPREYQTPPTAIPQHVRTPQSRHQSPIYIPNQSPLQSVEYNPGSRYGSQAPESPSGYGPPPGMMAVSPTAQQLPDHDRYEIYDPMPENGYGLRDHGGRYEDEEIDPRDQYDPRQVPYHIPPPQEFGSPPSPGGPPPPPPAHRSRNGSSQPSPAPAPVMPNSDNGYPQESRNTNQYNNPPDEAHRHSMPAYTYSKSYNAYSPEREHDQFRHSANEQVSPPRHHSYDSRYNGDHGSMQPTVEDAPPSPGCGNHSGRRGSYDPRYEKVPSPAPLNLGSRGSATSKRNSTSIASTHQYSSSSIGYNSTNSQSSFRDRSDVSSQTSYNSNPQQYQQRPRGQSANEMADLYGLPSVPATLVAGMDPTIAQELSERIYEEKRANHVQSGGNSARGRYQNSPQYQQNQSRSYHESPAAPFVPASSSYDERQSRFSAAAVPVVRPRAQSPNPPPSNRAVSPNPRHSITRKSVSPSPGAADDKRRLSGIPFGPDSYNALNPALSGSVSTPSLTAAYDTKPIDSDAKIITHDGREVDPSDHIPESNYAPLLESKGPKYASQQPDRNYRPPPSAQPVSATGRRPLRVAGRPQSIAASSPIYMNNGPYDPNTPPAGRNRLQKKANRMSAQPEQQSSPLGPVSPYQDNSFTPPNLPRAHTMDYNSNENYAPQQYGSSPGYRGSAPPIPAKVPMGMNGAPPPRPGDGDPWALLEEMKNIDLGSGRARRRGY